MLDPAFAAARNICRRHARSFYFSSGFLPEPKRQAAFAVYAFCRILDDAVDNADVAPTSPGQTCGPSSDLDAQLGRFRQTLSDVYAGTLVLPPVGQRTEVDHALAAFAQTVRRYAIPQAYFLTLADGCRMDLTVRRYPTWQALDRYCYHVAGVVGLMMCDIFGVHDETARRQAVQMGAAMQLTNILRDVREDADRGRIYLPLEDLAQFGYSQQDLLAGVVNEPFRQLMRFEIARARTLYAEAAEGLRQLPGDGSRFTACAMAVIYSGILTTIERQDYDVFKARAHLTTAQKFAKLLPALRLCHATANPDRFFLPAPRVDG